MSSMQIPKCLNSDNCKRLEQLSLFVSDISNLLLVLGVADLSPQEQELLRNIQKKKSDLLDEIKVMLQCFSSVHTITCSAL